MNAVDRKQTDATVVIRTSSAERWTDLCDAVASVSRQTATPREIVVVVDHQPLLLERARTQFPGVRVVWNYHAQGASGAMNTGIAAAQGDIVAFLDDDAVAAPAWLECLLAAFDDPAVQGAGGMIEPGWPGERPGWFPAEFDWVVGCVYRGGYAPEMAVRNLIGANMAFRRAVFDLVGPFRPNIGATGGRFLRCEDTEFCIRLRQRLPDAVLRYAPRARVTHRVSPERAQWTYFRARCFAEGQSKALLARLVGRQDGLGAEREYVRRTLPAGVWRGLTDGLRRGDRTGFRRAWAILAGLFYTAAGYLAGTVPATHALGMETTFAPPRIGTAPLPAPGPER